MSAIGLSLALFAPALGVGACATTQSASAQNDDTMITGRVGRRLTADDDVKRYQIDVDTIEGVVYLRGKVDSESIKVSAEQIAGSTDGVRQVVNELVVDADRDGDATDGDVGIKARVGTALSGNDDVKRRNVDVDVVDGVVTLSGIVESEAEATEAVRLAREADGVVDVQNKLQVRAASEDTLQPGQTQLADPNAPDGVTNAKDDPGVRLDSNNKAGRPDDK